MFSRLVQMCVVLTVFSLSSALTCRWIHHKFKQHNSECLTLLKDMKEDISVNTSIPENWHQWFFNHSHSQPEKQVWFMVQTLKEMTRLLVEAKSVSWSEDKLDTFLNMLQQQTTGLQLCVSPTMKRSKSKRLPLYFKRLRDLTQNKTVEKKKAWEQIRTELLQLLKLLDFFPAVSVQHAARHS
ncbi:interferon phi 4 [Trichomycterus rosablanca]|uniref:interferon phi 4 n=1 Tax=Trichomycterus rosablanca TaxID=2290929 RepID=UPI002F36029E